MKKKIVTVTLNPCLDKTITLPTFCEGGLNRAEAVRIDAGGKGINVAKVLRRFQAPVLATGLLGRGGSQPLLNGLEALNIEHAFHFVEGETRSNYKLFDASKRRITEVNEPGFSVDEASMTALFEKVESQLSETAVLVLAGSCPKGTPTETYARLIQLAHKHQVKTILDADGVPFAAGLAAVPYAVKPNQYELEQLHGGAFEDENAMYAYCHSILDRGVAFMIVSMGGDGAAFFSEGEAWRVTLSPIEVQSTVGAGDSMTAAAAYAVQQGMSFAELAQLATAAGTVTASKPGTEVCTQNEVLAYMPKLTLTKIW